jgi:hypothetical protein
MGKTPPRSRKDLRTSAPYRRSLDPAPAPGTPLAKVKLVPAPAPEPALPAVSAAPVAAPAAAVAAPPAAVAAPPAPVAAPPAPPATVAAMPPSDFLAALTTSLAFADATLAALPHPAELVGGDPTAPAPPPGAAPSGDARSLRTADQFALVYRHGSAVVTRRGTIGQRGAWRVVDYPSAALAAHAYALECSRLVAQGFRDLAPRSS